MACQVPVRVRGDARRQHLPAQHAEGLRHQVRGALSRPARRRGHVSRGDWQSRSAGGGQLRRVQHGRPPLLHVPAQRAPPGRARRGGCPVLRARQPRIRSPTAVVAAVGAGQLGNDLEDLLFPPPDLHVGPLHVRRARPAPRAGADFRRRRRRRRAQRPRALLRARQAAARDHVFHLRRRRLAAQGRYQAVGTHRARLRHRLPLHDDGSLGRYAVLPGHQPDGGDGGRGGDREGTGTGTAVVRGLGPREVVEAASPARERARWDPTNGPPSGSWTAGHR